MIAIIAGTGSLPGEVARFLLHAQKPFFVVSLFPEDNLVALQHEIQDRCPIVVQDVYKPSLLLNLLKEKKTTQVVMIGKVDKRALLKKVKLDWLGIKLLASVLYQSDASIMERIVAEFAAHNIEVLKQNEVLSSLLVKPGVLTGVLTLELQADITFGMQLAKQLSGLDVGQTVVVKDRMVLAVEAIEGTDECIQRGISLGKQDVVICKAAQLQQNKKFDLPTLGVATLLPLAAGQVKAIAWDSQHTLISEQSLFIQRAHALGITLVSV